MDNCGPHGSYFADPREQIKTSALPPNCTATHQPMQMGITSKWKQLYRSRLLETILNNMESRTERKGAKKGLESGTKRTNEGHDPHLLDAANMVNKSGDNVSDMTIIRCIVKAKRFPVPIDTYLRAPFGGMRNLGKGDSVK